MLDHRVDVACDLIRFFPTLAGGDPETTMNGGLYFMLASRLHAYGGAVTLTLALTAPATGANAPAPVVGPASAPQTPAPTLQPVEPQGPIRGSVAADNAARITPANGEVFTLAELGSIDPSTFECVAVSA